MLKTAKQYLREVRDYVADPSLWCQNSFAEDLEGKKVSELGWEARKFCLVGVIRRVCRWPYVENEIQLALNKSIEGKYSFDYIENLQRFNDESKHEEVLALIDKTIGDN